MALLTNTTMDAVQPAKRRCRPICAHTEPHHHATVWTIGLHRRIIGRRSFCALNEDWPNLWRSRADPGVPAGIRRVLMLVRSTNGYRGAALMPSRGYQNPAVAERIAQMLEQALRPD